MYLKRIIKLREAPPCSGELHFVSFEKNIIFELDGGQHALKNEEDTIRDAWLRSEGFEVLRFWNTEIFENLEGVLELIWEKTKTPSP
jgi:very-short-patch-repair endonuclease